VRADIRNPMIARIIESAEVDTVVHMNVIATPTASPGPHLPEGDQRHRHDAAARGVPEGDDGAASRREVDCGGLRLQPPRPGDVHRGHRPQGMPTGGFGKDSVEVEEGYVRGFARRRPDTEILMLRFANVVGPRIRTAITDYFSCRSSPCRSGTTPGCSSSTRTTSAPSRHRPVPQVTPVPATETAVDVRPRTRPPVRRLRSVPTPSSESTSGPQVASPAATAGEDLAARVRTTSLRHRRPTARLRGARAGDGIPAAVGP
jgi:hypothetical protein